MEHSSKLRSCHVIRQGSKVGHSRPQSEGGGGILNTGEVNTNVNASLRVRSINVNVRFSIVKINVSSNDFQKNIMMAC